MYFFVAITESSHASGEIDRVVTSKRQILVFFET
jgi:hypothetical protein